MDRAGARYSLGVVLRAFGGERLRCRREEFAGDSGGTAGELARIGEPGRGALYEPSGLRMRPPGLRRERFWRGTRVVVAGALHIAAAGGVCGGSRQRFSG